MNTHFSQSDRQGRLSTSLGKNALAFLGFDGTEKISDDFEWCVERLSADKAVDLHAQLGTQGMIYERLLEQLNEEDLLFGSDLFAFW